MIRRLAGLLGVMALAACSAPDPGIDFDTCGVRPRVSLPIGMVRNVPTIQARINGSAANFILDTGAESVVLTSPAVRRLELKSDPHRVISTVGAGGQSLMFPAALHDFMLGDLPIPDHSVPVLPKHLPDTGAGEPDGLLGVTILSSFELDLDMPHRRMTLYAGRLCPDTVLPPWHTAYATLDAGKSKRGRFIVPMEIDGHAVSALIDTGTQFTIIARDTALALGVTPEMLEHDRANMLVGSGPASTPARFHRFGRLRIGNDEARNPVLLVAERQIADADVILGMDYLAGRHLWLSWARRRVFIETPQPGPVASR